MSEICDGCKHSVGQCVPHGLPVNCCAYGCHRPSGERCDAKTIARYLLERLKEEELLRPYKESKSYKLHGHKWE